MLAHIEHPSGKFKVDLSQPIDISLPLRSEVENVNAFYAPGFEATPVVYGSFIGSVAAGGSVNALNVKINPHGNGTHTECVGHITDERYTINQCLKKFFFLAELISIYPILMDDGDKIIFKEQLERALKNKKQEAVVIRTLPNDVLKMRANYSGTNPPYLHHHAADYLQGIGVKHLLVDLPSVDKENDGGKVLAHRAFWQYPERVRADATITELIYVPHDVHDGSYLLMLQIASFEIDASPSKPVLYEIF